jgi:hypothetical protein
MLSNAPETPLAMSAFATFVRVLLEEGSARLREPPRLRPAEHAATLAVLREAHRDDLLDIAGPPLPFVDAVALKVVQWTAWACWFLVHAGEGLADLDRALPLFAPGPAASEHATADVVLRLLPHIHRRARAIDPQGALTSRLAELLRRWPLSGVLADLDEPPLTEVELGGHPGLLLLYAERLTQRPRPAWRVAGPARDWIELVFSERKLP